MVHGWIFLDFAPLCLPNSVCFGTKGNLKKNAWSEHLSPVLAFAFDEQIGGKRATLAKALKEWDNDSLF
jgi:hypothetical protein